MTEITKTKLTPVQQKFVLHWGEMGTRWGINRTVAQIHALLFLSPTPLHAEEIAATLGVARSNVSTSLRELQGWGIVRVTHILGDRRDHFESLRDVWELFRVIVDERKKREADPTLAMLREAVADRHGVWIGVTDRLGATTRHLVHPRRIEAGRVFATDDAGREQSWSVHRITGATVDAP